MKRGSPRNRRNHGHYPALQINPSTHRHTSTEQVQRVCPRRDPETIKLMAPLVRSRIEEIRMLAKLPGAVDTNPYRQAMRLAAQAKKREARMLPRLKALVAAYA